MKKEELTLRVVGMMCVHCEKTVVRAVEALGTKAKANKDLCEVWVRFDPAKTSKEDIVAAIVAEGFTVEG